MAPRKIIANAAVLFVAVLVGVLLCEFGARLFLNRVDYLAPTLVRDPILGITLPPRASGHDAWGFRNPRVPATAQIVTLGDSHTYGNCAKMTEAWPSVLALRAGKAVYNLGLGGYGPNQYYYLLTNRALALKPALVICGLYMGDDFDNAFAITHGLDYWAALREATIRDAQPDIWEDQVAVSWHKRARNWLSRNSIFYRVLVHGAALGKVKGRLQVAKADKLYESTSTLVIKEKNFIESFCPKGVLRGLNQETASVQEGMRLTFKLLGQMSTVCTTNGIQFLVAVIPTKETVFAEYLETNSTVRLAEVNAQVIRNERAAREKLFGFLSENHIRYVDTLPRLRKAIETENLYTYSALDMHPNNNGYRVIAESIAEALQSLDKK